MRNEETDLSFAEFGDPRRPYTAPRKESEFKEAANYLKEMVSRARFERATPSFGGSNGKGLNILISMEK